MTENSERIRYYDINGRADDIYIQHFKTDGFSQDHLHFHSKYELTLVLSGECELLSGGLTQTVNKPFIQLQPPFSFHKLTAMSGACFESFVFYFGESARERIETAFGGDLRQLYGARASICELDSVLLLQASVLVRLTLERIDDRMRSYILTGLLLTSDLASRKQNGVDSKPLGYLSDVVDEINTNISQKQSAEELAKRFFVSEQKLQNDFKRRFGETLHQYMLTARVSKAAMLIARGTPPIAASIECGFVDEGHFAKVFKSRIGLTPNRFAKQVSANVEYNGDFDERDTKL